MPIDTPLIPHKPISRYRSGRLEGLESESSSESDYEEVSDSHDQENSISSSRHVITPVFEKEGISETKTSSNFQNINPVQTIDNSASEYETDASSAEGGSNSAASSSEEEDSSDSEYEMELRRRTLLLPPKFTSKVIKNRAKANEEDTEVLKKVTSQKILEETIKRELLLKETKNNNELLNDIDDTDGIDPQSEYELWKLRHLLRKKRDKEKSLELEREKMAIEERRLMNSEEREAQDLKDAEASRRGKKKSSMQFLQKYYHKGAFYQNEDIVSKRDYSEATEGEVLNKDLLPKPMQIRGDLFAKAGQTRWTHLANEDTTKEGSAWYDPKNPILQKNLHRLGGLHSDSPLSKRKRT
ncbi:Microfibrillar-associated protein family protein [Schizosaccharomyces pombe]|uniref:Uncharacterized protein C1782.03 n=1 Tax=Schizosaccharomyces pombe (strain 972 / ATCC 24843) TaxID=284812 RepID=YLK3_SCHPO|nr:splicing-associated factor Saf3 [Schizosaccharomyces pombe]Q9P7H6.1 RecName: Full=Uncharacterized protein C1782.03 [Schizosaccharomyces pombe 972h-]CAB76265.1 splicing associated factor Saf3 [Schizosaccharomyces pombe]|eukprot:NP_594710.1 splicing-associated factor Saf3 [Schizosaccharomyces pombe]